MSNIQGGPEKKNPICMGAQKNTPDHKSGFFFWAHEFWPNLSKFMGPKKKPRKNYRAVCSATPPPVPPTGRPSVLPKFFVLVLNISSALLYYKKEIKLARTSIQKQLPNVIGCQFFFNRRFSLMRKNIVFFTPSFTQWENSWAQKKKPDKSGGSKKP